MAKESLHKRPTKLSKRLNETVSCFYFILFYLILQIVFDLKARRTFRPIEAIKINTLSNEIRMLRRGEFNWFYLLSIILLLYILHVMLVESWNLLTLTQSWFVYYNNNVSLIYRSLIYLVFTKSPHQTDINVFINSISNKNNNNMCISTKH